jgi:hypothetical protein
MAMTDKATNTPPKIFVQPYMNRGGVAAKDLILIAILCEETDRPMWWWWWWWHVATGDGMV